MRKKSPILSLISYRFSYPEKGVIEGSCPEYPGLCMSVRGNSTDPLVDLLRAEAQKRLETGELPRYAGKGETVVGLAKVSKNKPPMLLLIPDSWCALETAQLEQQVFRISDDWIKKAGKLFFVDNEKQTHSAGSLAKLISQKITQARDEFWRGKSEWDARLMEAQNRIRQEQEATAWIKLMARQLIDEAQRHIVSGARPRQLANRKPPGETLADNWHLYNFEQFNKRAQPEVIHRDESKDEHGNVTKSRTWVENIGGGELTAAAEQIRFLIQGISRDAEKGNEAGLLWLYRIAMFVTAEFWHVTEVQKDMAKKLSSHWQFVPIQWHDDPKLHKAIQRRTRGFQMRKSPAVSGKIKPESPHQVAVSRAQAALNYLIQSPLSLPPMPDGSRSDLFDEHLPDWLKKAQTLAWSKSTDLHAAAEILWDVYVAAMTATPKSPWRIASRPRKAKENFIKAVLVHKPQTP